MSRERTLHLHVQGVTAYVRRGKTWIAEAHFSVGAGGGEAFTDYLQEHKNISFRLLATLPSEEILSEHIPVLRGKDRQILIERRLEQHFPDSPLRTAISFGHSEDKPTKEKLLLAAFSQPSAFTPWLSQIDASDSLLSGIYSSTQLMPGVLGILHLDQECCLSLLLHQEMLHQTLLIKGQIRFSRIVANYQGQSAELLQEAAKLQQYLLNQRLLGREQSLQYIFLVNQEITPTETATANSRFIHFTEEMSCERLFLAALHEKPPAKQFASPQLRHAASQARRRLAASLLSLLVVSASLGSSAILFSRKQTWQKEIEVLQQRPPLEQDAGEDAILPLPGLRLFSQAYNQQHITLQPALLQLSQILEQHTDIELESLEWSNKEAHPTLLISGQWLPDNSDASTNHHAFEQFLAALRVDRNKQVNLRQNPLSDASNKPLHGTAKDQPSIGPKSFSLEWGGKP